VKYEIIKDKEDLLVLVTNNIVIAVSRDMSRIVEILQEDYSLRSVSYTKRYKPAVIEAKDTSKGVTDIKKPDDGSLGKLFTL
jgi:hypothetical protein